MTTNYIMFTYFMKINGTFHKLKRKTQTQL
jgi:hypothetical protein